MFRKKTLLENLDSLIKKITKTGREAQIINHIIFDSRNRQTLQVAVKLRDDINGKPVTYGDSDFLLASSSKNSIGKLLAKHKDKLPKQFAEQRSKVTDEHLDGVLHGTEQEESYMPKPWLQNAGKL